MPRADTNNAHIRGAPVADKKSREPSQLSKEADRLLNDPVFQRAMDVTEEAVLNLICQGRHDGSAEFEAAEREMCRTLRTLRSLRRVLTRTLQGEQLRLADFRSQPPDNGE